MTNNFTGVVTDMLITTLLLLVLLKRVSHFCFLKQVLSFHVAGDKPESFCSQADP